MVYEGYSIGRFDKLHLLSDMINWARDYTPRLAELLQLVNANYNRLQVAPGHGDFKDTNLIIDTTGRPILVDAEWGSIRRYRYRDVADFYYRLYTLACRPELAKSFLSTYTATLRKSQLPAFKTALLCLSAERAIGNFAEIEASVSGEEKVKRQIFAKRYVEDILSYAIIEEL